MISTEAVAQVCCREMAWSGIIQKRYEAELLDRHSAPYYYCINIHGTGILYMYIYRKSNMVTGANYANNAEHRVNL